MFKALTKFALLAFALCFSLVAHADDPCNDSKVEIRQLMVTGAPFGTEYVELDHTRTIARIRQESGDAVLLQWSYGAGGQIECSYIAYRRNAEPYRYFAVDSRWGYVRIRDIDGDGMDEVTLLEGQQVGLGCSDSNALIPHRLRITRLDVATGTLVDVTRTHGAFVRTFLIDLKKKYDVQFRVVCPSLCSVGIFRFADMERWHPKQLGVQEVWTTDRTHTIADVGGSKAPEPTNT